jgi:hypothetical protein
MDQMIQLMNLPLGKPAARFKHRSAKILVRYLGGDEVRNNAAATLTPNSLNLEP